MSKLWNINSPFIQKMTLISNLISLNLLCVICSLPIVTLGASTTAMYSVLFAYHRKETDSVAKPFFSAFRKSFRQSTVCWLAILILTAVLAFDAIHMIFDPEGFSLFAVPVVIAGILVVITGSYIFPQIALYQNKLLPMVKNGFLLFAQSCGCLCDCNRRIADWDRMYVERE